MQQIAVGQIGEATQTVTEALTAQSMGSGSLPVFATPALIALMESAATVALKSSLPPDQTSVGISVNIRHLAATALAKTVRARAEITDVEGRQITFSVQAWDETQLIGEGTHIRVIVEIERFLRRVNS